MFHREANTTTVEVLRMYTMQRVAEGRVMTNGTQTDLVDYSDYTYTCHDY